MDRQQGIQNSSKKKDQLEISYEAQEMQKDNKIIAERKEKVDSIKEKVEAGEYKIDVEQVAQKMYKFWSK